MTARLVLRTPVPADLHEIVRYLERESIPTADRFIAAVFAAFDQLAAMPGIGSPKNYRSPHLAGIRSWAVPGFPNHLIYYRRHADAVVVLAVLHGARDIPSILKHRLP